MSRLVDLGPAPKDRNQTYSSGHLGSQNVMQFVILLRQDVVEIRVETHRSIPVSPRIPRPNAEDSAEEYRVTSEKLIWPDTDKCSYKLGTT